VDQLQVQLDCQTRPIRILFMGLYEV